MYLGIMERNSKASIHIYILGVYFFKVNAVNAIAKEFFNRDGKYNGEVHKISLFGKGDVKFSISVMVEDLINVNKDVHGYFYVKPDDKRFNWRTKKNED